MENEDIVDLREYHSKNVRNLLLFGILFIALVALDQATKLMAVLLLKDADDFIIWDGVFRLHYLENSSAAFGKDPISLLQELFSFSYFTEHPDMLVTFRMAFFVIITLIVLALLLWLFIRVPSGKRFMPANLTITFFLAGAVGNLIDRVSNGYVVDFFYFELIDFPVFNVADIYVTLSACAIIMLCLFYYKDADYEAIFPGKSDQG